MKPQAFQPGELRDEYDQIIRAGAYGKKHHLPTLLMMQSLITS